eukprot:CAMPEP_0116554248 /NCGR_PEP_ID=MMETSP0397-20121206/7490_1 /TAXON_ID=216820 /ORGANISM="Cyclophora tenuis, Strain ECT3854" /LENGTH=60 /DNA_ID=CAMNT_0004079395 /DNA_START=278 /DNA_END=460 /DNA_ORIENTATION=-
MGSSAGFFPPHALMCDSVAKITVTPFKVMKALKIFTTMLAYSLSVKQRKAMTGPSKRATK